MSIAKKNLILDYSINQLTTREIASKWKVGATTVKRLLKKYEIPINNKRRNTKSSSIIDRNFLENEYLIKGKTCKQIGKEVGLSPATISTNLNRFGIVKRVGTRKGCPTINTHIPEIDLSGKQYHNLKILKYVKGGWLCECICGQTKIYQTKRFTDGKIRSCGCSRDKTGSDHHLWKGYGDISQAIYSSYYEGAIDRNLEFDISIEYLWNLFLEQKKLCNLTKKELQFSPKRQRTASLDRIDSSKGYIEGNVQWVHKTINQLKWNYTQEEFITWCKLVANNN